MSSFIEGLLLLAFNAVIQTLCIKYGWNLFVEGIHQIPEIDLGQAFGLSLLFNGLLSNIKVFKQK